MKLGAKSAPAPAEQPADTAPAEEPADTQSDDNLDFSTDASGDTGAADNGDTDTSDAGGDKPFEKEPFDADVEADEEEDPKKFIEQLTGKLGQSLRKYNEEQGEPDFELEKFAINSLLSATHTGEMDSEDQKDIIKKIKKSGKGDDNAEPSDETGNETTDAGTEETGDEAEVEDTGTEAPADDSENMFETEMLDEMSLNDHMAKSLINLYDNGDEKTRKIIFRLVTLMDPFEEKDEKDKEINKEKFTTDLRDDIDKENLDEIFNDLKEMGIYADSEIEITESFDGSFILQNPPKNSLFQEGALEEKDDRCTRIAKRKYDVWPSAYASGAVVKCRQGKIWKNVDENYMDEIETLKEKWSEKYKRSIDCNNPKGFSQKAHCQGRKKND